MTIDEYLDREYKKYLKWLEEKGHIYQDKHMTEYAEGATDGYDHAQQLINKFTKETI